MRKVLKYLAVILALTLIVGTIPVQAAGSVTLSKTSKILFIDGCTGSKANGSAAKFYSYMNVQKVVKNFDAKTMDIKLSSDDKSVCTVNNKKDRIYAKGLGVADVTVTVTSTDGSTLLKKKIQITVKKNATNAGFQAEGIENGASYKVGDTVTVSMPLNGDTDKRRVVVSPSNAATVTKKTSTKFVVEFVEAGDVTVKAEAFQSDSYPGTTASKSFSVKVTDDSVKPTPTPTATPTATPTPEPTKAPAAKVEQVALNGIEIDFGKAAPTSAKTTDFKVYYLLSGVKITGPTVKEVKVDGNKATLSCYTNFTAKTEYFVDYGEETFSFTAIEAKAENVTSVEVAKTQIKYGDYVTLDLKYYIGKIDVTSAVASDMTVDTEIVGNNDYAYAYGKQVYITDPEKTATIKITVLKGYNPDTLDPLYVTKTVAIVSEAAPKVADIMYTLTKDDGVYMTKTDKQYHSFAIDDMAVLEALFKYSDGSYKTIAEMGIDSWESSDPRVIMPIGTATSGGIVLAANNEGKAFIIFMKDGQPVKSCEVTVTAASKVTKLEVSYSKRSLNVSSFVSDSLDVKVKVIDQFGNEMKSYPALSITQNDTTRNAFGYASFGAFNSDGVLTVHGSDISMIKPGTIAGTIECDKVTVPVSFTIADASTPKTWILNSTKTDALIRLDAAVKEGDVKPESVSFGVNGVAEGNLLVSKENLDFLTKFPSPSMKASDFGMAPGDVFFAFTVTKDGKILETLPAAIEHLSDTVTFSSFVHGAKLEKGTYEIKAYKITGGDTKSTVANVGTKTITVVDTQATPSFTLVSKTTATNDPETTVATCMKFSFNGKELFPLSVSDVDANASTTMVYVKSVKVNIYNNYYGDCPVEVNVQTSFDVK